MSRAKPGGSVARADNLFSGAMSRAMLYAKPGGGGSFCCSLTCSQGALFTQDIKCLPVPQQELGSSLCMVQPTGCLGLGQLQHDLGGGNCREQRKKGRERPAGDAESTQEHVLAASRAHGGGRRAAATARPPRTSQVRFLASP